MGLATHAARTRRMGTVTRSAGASGMGRLLPAEGPRRAREEEDPPERE